MLFPCKHISLLCNFTRKFPYNLCDSQPRICETGDVDLSGGSSVNTLVNRDSGGGNKREDSYFVSAAHAVLVGDGSSTMPGRVSSMTGGGSMTSAVYARYFPFCQRIRSPHCFTRSACPFDKQKRLFAGIDIA